MDDTEEHTVLTQLEQARLKLNRLAQSSLWDFKVGRASARGFDALAHRKMYLGSSIIHELTRTSRDGAALIEEELTHYACNRYGSRVRNQQVGGGGQANDHEHVVYLVQWPNPISEAGRRLFDIKPTGKKGRR